MILNQELKTIQLYGWLGKQFGREHKLAVRDAAEAIRALSCNFPAFEKALIEAHAKNQGFRVTIGKESVACERKELPNKLREPVGQEVIKIIPAVAGSKNPFGQIFAGVALIFASTFFPPLAAAANAAKIAKGVSMFSGIGSALSSIGVAVALGGVTQLISPQKRSLSTADGPNNGASYNFNGAVNTTAQGNPVPVLHGRCVIGGQVVSAGIYAEDQA